MIFHAFRCIGRVLQGFLGVGGDVTSDFNIGLSGWWRTVLT